MIPYTKLNRDFYMAQRYFDLEPLTFNMLTWCCSIRSISILISSTQSLYENNFKTLSPTYFQVFTSFTLNQNKPESIAYCNHLNNREKLGSEGTRLCSWQASPWNLKTPGSQVKSPLTGKRVTSLPLKKG